MGDHILYGLTVSTVNVIRFILLSILLAEAFRAAINIIDKWTIKVATASGKKVEYYEASLDLNVTKGKDVVLVDGKHRLPLLVVWILPVSIIGLEIFLEFSFDSTVVKELATSNICYNETKYESTATWCKLGTIPALDSWIDEFHTKETREGFCLNDTMVAILYSPFTILANCFNVETMAWYPLELRYQTTLAVKAENDSSHPEVTSLDIYSVYCDNRLAQTENKKPNPAQKPYNGKIKIEHVAGVRLGFGADSDHSEIWRGYDILTTVSYSWVPGAPNTASCIMYFSDANMSKLEFISCDFSGEFHCSNNSYPISSVRHKKSLGLGDLNQSQLLSYAQEAYQGTTYTFFSDVAFQNNSQSLWDNHVFNNQMQLILEGFEAEAHLFASIKAFSGTSACGPRTIVVYDSVPTVNSVIGILLLVLLPIGLLFVVYDTFFDYLHTPVNRFRDLVIVNGVIQFRHPSEQPRQPKPSDQVAELMSDPLYTMHEADFKQAQLMSKLDARE